MSTTQAESSSLGKWDSPDGLYYRWGAALHDADDHSCQLGEGTPYADLLSAIIRVRDEEMEQLRAELAAAQEKLARARAALEA